MKNKVKHTDFRSYYKAVIIKTVWFTERIDRNDPHKYGQLIFDKGVQAIQWRKGSLFDYLNGASTLNGARTILHAHVKMDLYI